MDAQRLGLFLRSSWPPVFRVGQIMARPVPGEYVTIIKAGEFGAHSVKPGDRAVVLSLNEHYSTKNKKVWALVDLVHNAGAVGYGRINIPLWWLKPRSILDDLGEL